MIRIGIIGLGWWGKQIVAESTRFKLVAGCDIDHNTVTPFAGITCLSTPPFYGRFTLV